MTETTITIPVPLHRELQEHALRAGVSIDIFLEQLLRESHTQTPSIAENDALKTARERVRNRTTEEIEEARRRIFQSAHRGRELPEGMTLEEALKGTWPGDEIEDNIPQN